MPNAKRLVPPLPILHCGQTSPPPLSLHIQYIEPARLRPCTVHLEFTQKFEVYVENWSLLGNLKFTWTLGVYLDTWCLLRHLEFTWKLGFTWKPRVYLELETWFLLENFEFTWKLGVTVAWKLRTEFIWKLGVYFETWSLLGIGNLVFTWKLWVYLKTWSFQRNCKSAELTGKVDKRASSKN